MLSTTERSYKGKHAVTQYWGSGEVTYSWSAAHCLSLPISVGNHQQATNEQLLGTSLTHKHSPNVLTEKCISEVMRIDSVTIFHLSKL